MDSAMDFPSNPELHNVICMEPRRIPDKNLLSDNGWVDFMSSVSFCQRIWIETKRSPQTVSKSMSHQKSLSYTSKILGNVFGIWFQTWHTLKFENKNLWAFSKKQKLLLQTDMLCLGRGSAIFGDHFWWEHLGKQEKMGAAASSVS